MLQDLISELTQHTKSFNMPCTKDIKKTMNLIDDIIVHGDSQEEHDTALLKLLHCFEETYLNANSA